MLCAGRLGEEEAVEEDFGGELGGEGAEKSVPFV